MTTRRPFAQVLRVTLVDTPGYGDKLDSARTPARAVHLIFNHALRCLRRKLAGEQSVRGSDPLDAKARNASDEHTMRVALIASVSTPVQAHPDEQLHCLLYFVPPHRLLRTDRLFLQRMQRLMPVIVVIAKADTLSDDELAAQRAMLRNELAHAHISPYTFSEDAAHAESAPPPPPPAGLPSWLTSMPSEISPAEKGGSGVKLAHDAERESKLPLSCRRYSRGRQPGEALAVASRSAAYPWGRLSATDPDHSDLLLLQQLLLSHHAEVSTALSLAHPPPQIPNPDPASSHAPQELVHIARQRYHEYRRRRLRVSQLTGLISRAVFCAAAAHALLSPSTWPSVADSLGGLRRPRGNRAPPDPPPLK